MVLIQVVAESVAVIFHQFFRTGTIRHDNLDKRVAGQVFRGKSDFIDDEFADPHEIFPDVMGEVEREDHEHGFFSGGDQAALDFIHIEG